MSWVSAIWSAAAAICLTLAAVHFLVWFNSRKSWANLLFAVSATSAAVCAIFELKLMHSQTPAEFGEVLRWFHVPVAVMAISLMWFVRQYLRSGRLWLIWLFCGLRVVTLTLTFTLEPNLNFREITGLHPISAWGETIVSPIGVKNPWTNITHASAVVLLVFVVDAAVAAWRKGRRRPAVVVGTTVSVGIVVALTFSELLNRGGAPIPFTMSLAFLIIIVGMAYELSIDVLNANRLARELHENQERMSLAAKAATLGIWDWDIVRDDFWVTETVRERYGVGKSERISFDRLLQAVHPDDHERIRRALDSALKSGVSEVEYRVLGASGIVRWVVARGRVEHDAAGKPVRLNGISIDITERKLAEERFRLVVEASPNAMIMVNSEGLITLVNSQTETVFGYPRAELMGQPIETLVPECYRSRHPGDRIDFSASLNARAMGMGRELFGRRKDGNEIPVEIGLNPIRTPEGLFVLASIVDITERKHAEKEIQSQRAELAHISRVATMGQLASALAHELSQPLGAILRNAEAAELLLEREPPDLEELKAIVEDIQRDDQRAGAVIDRMRSLLKRRELNFEPLSLNQLFDQVAVLLHSELTARRVTTQLDVPTHLPLVRGDRVHLQQVILNLLVNGADTMNDLPAERRRLLVRTRVKDPQTVEVAVSDCGHGIPKEKLTLIFDLFFTNKSNGMGIGLAISKTIIESHGGRIWAENNPQGGATFRFTLKTADARGTA